MTVVFLVSEYSGNYNVQELLVIRLITNPVALDKVNDLCSESSDLESIGEPGYLQLN